MGNWIGSLAGMANAQGRYEGATVGGRYRLGKLLGEGGMGAVYRAEALDRPGQPVALKLLHDEMAASPNVVERFLAEGDVCRRLDHPGVLRVLDVGHQNGVPYLVMELLEGRALIDYTEAGQRLPLNFAVTVCAGVLHALEYAHQNHVIHRDLKPENVFLVPDGQGAYRTKLLDFGIARCIDAAGGAKRRTATGVLLGTPGYMSPEQVKAARNVDHRADLWAVGVMFYEMVTGQSAFPSDGEDPNNIWGLISAVLTKDPVPLVVFDKHLAPFDSFIHRALAKDPDKRYGSAKEMSDDLLRIARGEVQTGVPANPSIAATAVAGVGPAMGAMGATAAAPAPGLFTREQQAVPIHSRGELQAIPALQQRGGAASSTVPTGLDRGLPPLNATVPVQDLGGTVPMQPQPRAPQPYGSAPQALIATAYAPPDSLPGGGRSPSVAPPPSGGRTSPSGFAPLEPHVPAGPSPLIPRQDNARDDEGSGSGPLPWIILGAILIAALVAAIVWLSR